MAVYKPTLCYPFLNSMDIRVAKYSDFEHTSIKPYQYLSCKIDSSNKEITGYKIRILTSDNQQVFPVGAEHISPISELQFYDLGYIENTASVNSGLNGTTLRMPFFQNESSPILSSYNAVYYRPAYLTDYVIAGGLDGSENISNWTFNVSGELVYKWPENTPAEEKKANEIILDGEAILIGQTVFVIGTIDGIVCTGIWQVDGHLEEYSKTMTTVLTKLIDLSDPDDTSEITLIKGKTRHNHTFKIDTTKQYGYVEIVTGGQWYDVSGNLVPLFNSNKTSYKWEVTLYQGNPEEEEDTLYPAVVYSDVDPEWLDMTLSSGKIMGSTPERIQISDNNEQYLPTGVDNAPIVLQGKYIELSNTESTSITTPLSGGVRVYVKTYDSVYGHIYPATDSLNLTNIEQAQSCQFFKYSSDPSEILDTDIVSFVYTTSVELSLIGLTEDENLNPIWGDLYALTSESEFKAKYTINQRHLVATQTVETVVSPATLNSLIKDGDLILLQNQSDPKTNGVYMVSQLTAKDGENHDITYWSFVRPNGYNTWANYIGKIIYCMNGSSSRGLNMQSLASAGGNLWDLESTSSGSSALYLVQERPLLLFPNKLKQNRTFSLFDTTNSRPSLNTTVAQTSIDGVSISAGDTILYKDGKWGTVSEVDSAGYKLSNVSGKNGSVAANDYVYILNGQTLGQLVFKYINSSTTYDAAHANWDLHTGKILKNSTTQTYISPWQNLQKNMKLELLNNKMVYYTNEPTIPTRWIKVNDYNNVVFKITHDELTSALSSYSKEDTTIPWSYDIKYFFRISDENPFYSYETPYITLYKNDKLYSDLKIVGGTFYFYTRPTASSPATDAFLVYDTRGGYSDLFLTNYEAQSVVTGRSVKLKAEYIGLGQSSWESYRWVLYDADGNIVQDTGKRYDKDMSVVFFGLSNDSSDTVVYRAVLLIENNFGDVISYVLNLVVDPGSISRFLRDGGSFTATLDCSTQSSIITFLESGMTKTQDANTFLYSIYRREYEVLDRPGKKIYCYYHDGQCYKTADYTPDNIVSKNSDFVYVDNNTKFVYQYKKSTDNFVPTEAFRVYKGEWEPVIIASNKKTFRDFNISNNRSYEYIVYPSTSKVLEYGLDTTEQTFANYDGLVWISSDEFVYVQPTNREGHLEHGDFYTSVAVGEPIHTNWQCWSITELIPEELNIDAPIVKKQYKVDNNNIWLLKYSLETGNLTQNISKEEFQTLGQFPKFGFGDKNFVSGNVTALLGSELVLSSKVKYVERLGENRIKALTTNERVMMSRQWQEFCYSKNPKLLKDMKGQSWIVQLVNNSVTPNNFIPGYPDTISFEWKQIDDTNNIIIYGDYDTDDVAIKESVGGMQWKKVF